MNPVLIAAVAVGGALGSVARYLTVVAAGRWFGSSFPWGTLAVNLIGSLVMGILAELAAQRLSFPEPWRVFLFVGILGGFTTFSSFSLDVVTLMNRSLGLAFAYVAGTLLLGIGALFLGLALVRWTLRV